MSEQLLTNSSGTVNIAVALATEHSPFQLRRWFVCPGAFAGDCLLLSIATHLPRTTEEWKRSVSLPQDQ